MVDSQLRYLERAAAASGDVGDQAAVLTERVRGGLLTPERLKLAAYCGDHAARLAAGLPFVVDNPHRRSRTKGFRVESWSAIDDDTLGRWMHGLTFWNGKTTVRGLAAGARAALKVWARRFGVRRRPDGSESTVVDGPCGDARCCPHSNGPPACNHAERSRPRRAVEAVENWLLCPETRCDDCWTKFHLMTCTIGSSPDIPEVSDDGGRTRHSWWLGPVTAAMWVIGEPARDAQCWTTLVEHTALGVGDILDNGRQERVNHGSRLPELLFGTAGQNDARAAMSRALVAWALGGDA